MKGVRGISLRDIRQDFAWYYNRYLVLIVERIEQEKEESLTIVNRAKIRTFILCAIAIIGMILYAFISDGMIHLEFCFFLIASIYTFSYVFPAKREKKRILDKIKAQLIRPIIQFISPNLTYDFENKIAKKDFLEANFVEGRSIDVYTGEDLMYGNIQDVSIAFSELNVQKEVRTRNGTKRIDLFKGLFFRVDFHKPFQGSLYTRANNAVPKMFKKMTSPNNNQERLGQVTLENPQFMKRYDVQATDQTLARFVLTPSLMERMLAFEQKKGNTMEFAFRDGVMFLGLRTEKDHFNFELNDTLNEEKLFSYLEEINLAVEIIEELQLNVHVWK